MCDNLSFVRTPTVVQMLCQIFQLQQPLLMMCSKYDTKPTSILDVLVFRLECLVVNVSIITCLPTSLNVTTANMLTGQENVGNHGPTLIHFVGQTMPDSRTCHVGKKSSNMLVYSFWPENCKFCRNHVIAVYFDARILYNKYFIL